MSNSRFVDDQERLDLLRGHITYAMEIVETFRVLFEDRLDIIEGINAVKVNPEAAVSMLDDALNRLHCAYQDTFDSLESDEDAQKIDVMVTGEEAYRIISEHIARAKAEGTYNPSDWDTI